jgi:D-serine dehydratase
METLLSGIFTIEDKELFNYMRELDKTEGIRIEPSACATFEGPIKLFEYDATREYLKKNNLTDKLENINHIAWATGGNLVPNEIMESYLETYL